jgi:hypothetical protein
MLKDIVMAVREELPNFNRQLLVELRENEMDNLPQFVADRYRECVGVADDPSLQLLDYEILSPKNRLEYELKSGFPRLGVINIRDDETILVKYKFRYGDELFDVPLYIPYILEDSMIRIKGTHYECLLNMTEKLFSIRTGSNGITIKLVRIPVSCWRNIYFPFEDVFTREQFVGNVVTCKIHYKESVKSKIKPTIIHYLLCKFSLPEVLARFNLPKDAAVFCEHEEPNPDFHYFKVKHTSNVEEVIYLKVQKSLMVPEYRMLIEIVTAIVYMMSSFRFIMYSDLVEDSKYVFMTLLGKLIWGLNTDKIHAYNYMVKHIRGVDIYLDEYNKKLFNVNGYAVNDIYDLLCFIAEKIGEIIATCPNNNMYNKRLEAINNVIIDGLVNSLYYRIYRYSERTNHEHLRKQIIKSLKVHPREILKSLDSSESVRFSPTITSDNWLLSVGCKIVKRLSASNKPRRQVGKKRRKKVNYGSGINASVNKFHPSMIVVESPIGFSSKPGTNCIANPYAEIDTSGGFVRNQVAMEAAKLSSYLTNDIVFIPSIDDDDIKISQQSDDD